MDKDRLKIKYQSKLNAYEKNNKNLNIMLKLCEDEKK